MNELELTGRARTHIVELESPRCGLHYEAAASFLAMREAAAREGIDLVACSSFRDFDAQLAIWNRKWRGERPLYDRQGRQVDAQNFSETELVELILCWSAIPGGSRHHWGTDVDVIDAAAAPRGTRVDLLPDEYAPGGIFERLSGWLDEHMYRFGFFRPYRFDRGAVGAEPWHLSYAPVSMPALEALGLPTLRRALADSDVAGKNQILARLPEIYTRFLLTIDLP